MQLVTVDSCYQNCPTNRCMHVPNKDAVAFKQLVANQTKLWLLRGHLLAVLQLNACNVTASSRARSKKMLLSVVQQFSRAAAKSSQLVELRLSKFVFGL